MKLNVYFYKPLRFISLFIILSWTLSSVAQIRIGDGFYRIKDQESPYYIWSSTVTPYLTTYSGKDEAASDIWEITSQAEGQYTIQNFNTGYTMLFPYEKMSGYHIIPPNDDDALLELTKVPEPNDVVRFRITSSGRIYPVHASLSSESYSIGPIGRVHTNQLDNGFLYVDEDYGAISGYAPHWSFEEVICEPPVISLTSVSGNTGTVTISCPENYDANHLKIYYTTDGSAASTSSTLYSGPFAVGEGTSIQEGDIINAIAVIKGTSTNNVIESKEAEPLTIDLEHPVLTVSKSSDITNMSGSYILGSPFVVDATVGTSDAPFTGTIDGQLHTIASSSRPLVGYANGATIKNVIIKNVSINNSGASAICDGNTGAICCEAQGTTRIYNCGILPNNPSFADETSTVSGSNYCGSLVGKLSGNARVINCFSYATVTGGSTVAGIVGYIGNTEITQDNVSTVPMVVNCMFYGEITGGETKYPVYGGAMIKNDADKGVNPYCYFRKNATFDNAYTAIANYNRSWPAEEKNLTRFEYYRSILNSNKKLCTYWVTGKVYGSANAPTEADEALIAKWVLDQSIAPYPILKEWGKYPSVINIDPEYRINPTTKAKEKRSTAKEWEGKSYGTLTVYVNPGTHHTASQVTMHITITDMDTVNKDFCYYKIQLPYYNEVFGNPAGTTHKEKYGDNYTEYVVTGWDITEVNGSTTGSGPDFVADWATGYDFADRTSTKKDLKSVSGRTFAQGGYYYVPVGVSDIKIVAHWGKAVYLANRGYSIDRVKLTIAKDYKNDKPFEPAGTVSDKYQGQTVYNDLQNAIKALNGTTANSNDLNQQVYDQAIVLIGNHQVQNGSNKIGYSLGKWYPHTIMSADFDFDNEPDFCLELQFRNGYDRPGIQPVRFDFLPVVELGLAVRHNNYAYAIGIFVPHGHFEMTETSFMRTTQFEYDGPKDENYRVTGKSPVIINGGEYELFNVRYANASRTSYFLLGGKAWIHRFAPGAHPNTGQKPTNELCVVNAIGGEYPEFYLSGIYRPELGTTNTQAPPHCYTNGGKFGIMAGAGYDKVKNGVTFKINHSFIGEFYGGGINGSNPIGGNIDVTINNSYVTKYCGGPKVGNMTGKTVTTNATNTTFGVFYGGGNGGNSYYRALQRDGNFATSHIGTWTDQNYNWNGFNPLNLFTVSGTTNAVFDSGTDNKGYHAEYEFEVFNESNGVTDEITQRGFIRWIQFGLTITGNVTNVLTGCTIEGNFYGGGNLATVDGTVTSTLTNTTVKGNVFGAGFSADIPTFSVHNKDSKVFPTIDYAGTITDGHIDYVKDGGEIRKYEWTNDLNGMTQDNRKKSPGYQKDGKWYCYTWNPLTNLGVVLDAVSLTINGTSEIGSTSIANSGNVYGGGEESSVDGTTSVILDGDTHVFGDVYGGGKSGNVTGASSVTINATQKK